MASTLVTMDIIYLQWVIECLHSKWSLNQGLHSPETISLVLTGYKITPAPPALVLCTFNSPIPLKYQNVHSYASLYVNHALTGMVRPKGGKRFIKAQHLEWKAFVCKQFLHLCSYVLLTIVLIIHLTLWKLPVFCNLSYDIGQKNDIAIHKFHWWSQGLRYGFANKSISS